MTTCDKCGALVGSVSTHDHWHAAQDELVGRVDLVEDQAESTANVLYQRGID